MDPVDQVVDLVAWWEIGIGAFVLAHVVAREVVWYAERLMDWVIVRVERHR